MKRALVTGIGGQDGSYLAELLLDRRLRGCGSGEARRRRLREHRCGQGPDRADRGGLARPGLARRRARADETPGGLQPRLALVRARLVGSARDDRRVRGRRRDVAARGDPRRRPVDPVLPGVVERDLRRAARQPANRGHTARPGNAVRRCEGVCALHRQLVSPPVRPVRLLRDPLQPRVAAASTAVPAAQGRARSGGDLPRPAGRARARRSRCAARLGLRRRLRPRDVADAAAGRPGRLHRRLGREPLRSRVRAVRVRPRGPRLAGVRSRRSRSAARRGRAAPPRRRFRPRA